MKDTRELQDILFAQMNELVNGDGDIKKAKAITKLASQAIYITRLEVENKRLELEVSKSNEDVKKWMEKDFSNIQNIKVGSKQ